MDFYVKAICLLIFLNDFSKGENTESFAIRNQNKYREPGILINKINPQKVYVRPNMLPKVNPTEINLRLDTGLNVPKIIIPANQHKTTIPQNVPALNEPKPSIIEDVNHVLSKKLKKTDTSAVSLQKNYNENERLTNNDQQAKDTKQFLEELDQNDLANMNTKKATSNQTLQQNKPQAQSKNEDTSQFTVTPKSNLEETRAENSSTKVPVVIQKDTNLVEKENETIEIPKNNTQSTIVGDIKESTSERRYDPGKEEAILKLGTVFNNNAKETIPLTIYKLDDITDEYSKSLDSEQFYPSRTDFSINQPTNNIVIKNQNVEELCESSQDNINQYQPEYQQQYSYYELPTNEANYYPQYSCYNIPRYQDAGYIPYNSRDRIWRNWKTTEISISKYEPEVKLNNDYDKYNGFNMPITNGDIGYDCYKQNVPLYQSYVYPTYKYV